MTNRAVFLDKDGTLVHDVPYNADPARIALMPGALEGLARLADAGYELVVVSNQSGVARGYFPAAALRAVERRLQELAAPAGVRFAGFYFCPHLPGGSVPRYACECVCRKPRPGLILRAAADLGLDLGGSWLIGDILHDIEAGRRAGCRTVLLDNGHETEWDLGALRTPHILAADLREAADRILEAEYARTEKRG
ncbi:MAG: D-glycero-alpha-D-manno-heptose-1,7-bisphosphate 7-phosphatase [Hyphomicrobiales bacterium]